MASECIQRPIETRLNEAEQTTSRSDWESVDNRAQNLLALDPGNQEPPSFPAAADRALVASSAPSTPSPATSAIASTPDQLRAPSAGPETSSANGRYMVQPLQGECCKKRVY